MEIIERDVVLQSKTADGKQTIDFPVTALRNIEESSDIKESVASEDYIPLIDSSDNGQMKKTRFSAFYSAIQTLISSTFEKDIQSLINSSLEKAMQAGTFKPVKGVDYWTAEDQESIVNDVLANFIDVSVEGQ